MEKVDNTIRGCAVGERKKRARYDGTMSLASFVDAVVVYTILFPRPYMPKKLVVGGAVIHS
jgi:hypothetical protein